MRRSQLAIVSVSTRHASLDEAFDAYATAGFRNVEFDLTPIKDWLTEGHTTDELLAKLAAHDLRFVGGLGPVVECFTSVKSQQANQEIVLANASLVDELGGSVLGVGTDGPPEPSLTAIDTVAARFRDLAGAIEGLNIAIALEFNWSPLIRSLQSAVLVCEKVDHPQVGVLFDPAHYYTTPTKSEHLDARAGQWIRHVHLNDMDDKPADLSNCNSDRVLPGKGVLDLGAIIAGLEDHGYTGFYSIEMFNEFLWQVSAEEAAHSCFQSLLPLCSE